MSVKPEEAHHFGSVVQDGARLSEANGFGDTP
jgi:hypothetical protein